MRKQLKKCMGLIVVAALVAQAAAPTGVVSARTVKPKLSTKKVTVKKGVTKKVTVKNAKGFKITVKIKNKKIAAVKKKSTGIYEVKGVNVGNTTVTFAAKKNRKKFNLKCTVVVNAAVEKADTPTVAPSSGTTVSTAPTANPTTQPTVVTTVNPTAAPTDTPAPTEFVFIPPEPIKVELTTDAPEEYREMAADAPKDAQGTIETITYETETYDEGNSVPMTKQANVYLPAGYDESKQYNVFYLMHGGGENMNTWLVENDYTGNKKMLDNLIRNGVIEPLIVVTPTFYRPSGAPEIDAFALTSQFAYELRKDLIPYIESHYSTYADRDVSDENLIKTRMHRAFAGLSMGSMTTYRAALYANYDVFGWFGPYSGCAGGGGDTDAEAEKIVATIEEGAKKGMPLGFLYCGNGEKDMAHDEHVQTMEKVLGMTDYLVEGANYAFIDLPYKEDRSYGGKLGEHSMWSWHVHFYNCLRVFFTRE